MAEQNSQEQGARNEGFFASLAHRFNVLNDGRDAGMARLASTLVAGIPSLINDAPRLVGARSISQMTTGTDWTPVADMNNWMRSMDAQRNAAFGVDVAPRDGVDRAIHAVGEFLPGLAAGGTATAAAATTNAGMRLGAFANSFGRAAEAAPAAARTAEAVQANLMARLVDKADYGRGLGRSLYVGLRQMGRDSTGLGSVVANTAANGVYYGNTALRVGAGAATTAALGLPVAHMATGGQSSEMLGRGVVQAAEGTANIVSTVAPAAAQTIREAAPQALSLAGDYLRAGADAATTAITAGAREANIDVTPRQAQIAGDLSRGRIIGAGLDAAGVETNPVLIADRLANSPAPSAPTAPAPAAGPRSRAGEAFNRARENLMDSHPLLKLMTGLSEGLKALGELTGVKAFSELAEGLTKFAVKMASGGMVSQGNNWAQALGLSADDNTPHQRQTPRAPSFAPTPAFN